MTNERSPTNEEIELGYPQPDRLKELHASALRRRGLGDRYLSLTIQDISPSDYRDKLLTWMQNISDHMSSGDCLFILGSYENHDLGTPDRFGALILKELLWRKGDGYYLLYQTAMDYWIDKKIADNQGTLYRSVMLTCPLLLLDGIPNRFELRWKRDILSRILNERYMNSLSTVIMSEWDLSALRDATGSLFDRIVSVSQIIRLPGARTLKKKR